jgi:hypothetical protein
MDRHNSTAKLVGTAWSRTLDIQSDLQEQVELDPEIVFRGSDLLDKIDAVEACLAGTFTIALDESTNLRLNVADRVDVAMGIDHLRVDTRKRETDDFISSDTYKLVEAAAKHKQDLTWAKRGVFPGSQAGQVGRFSGKPSPKSTGGGYKPSGSNTGRGGGNSRGGGRGRGRGRGRGKGRGGKGRGDGQSSSGGD